MARKLVWEVPRGCWPSSIQSTEASILLAGAGVSTQVQANLPLVTFDDVEQADRDFVWVERIIGQVMIVQVGTGTPAIPATDQCMAFERIHKGLNVAVQGGANEVFQLNTEIEGAEEPFLWNRIRAVERNRADNSGNASDVSLGDGGARQVSPYAHPWWTAIDCKVGRSLRTPEMLAYSIATTLPTGYSLQAWCWLRVLLSR